MSQASVSSERPKQTAATVVKTACRVARSLLLAVALMAGYGVHAAVAAKRQITIQRDQWGVPHIDAATEWAGFYGLGWAEAQDQLGNLLSEFLAVQGRAATVYGEGETPWGAPAVQSDWEALEWHHEDEAKVALAQLPEPIRRQQQAFVAGFRAYMEAHPEKVPTWAPAVEAWMPIALVRYLLWDYDIYDGLRSCVRGGVHPEVAPPPERLRASDEWVISGKRTADGRTILLNDPHGDINGAPFYEFAMHAGRIHAIGYAIGSLLLLANTSSVAWGFTTGGPAVSDCYNLPVDADGSYRVFGRTKNFRREHAVIAVKGAGPIQATFRYAQINGLASPVIYANATNAYAITTPYYDRAGQIFVQIDEMIRAKTTGEVLNANAALGIFPQNLLIGDSHGSIAYIRTGLTPRRDPSIDRNLPLPADDLRTRWQGMHPYTDLVMYKDSPGGFIQNDNYPPLNIPEIADHIPRYPSDIINSLPESQTRARGDRITELVSAVPHPTFADAEAFALDEKWPGTERWTRLLAESAKEEVLLTERFKGAGRAVLKRLLAFDGVARADSVAALNHLYWRAALWASLDPRQQNELVGIVEQGVQPAPWLARKAIAAVAIAVINMNSDLGNSSLPYGEVFRIGRGARNWPLGGGSSFPVDPATCLTLEPKAGLCVQTQRAFVFKRVSSGKELAQYGSRILRLIELGDSLRYYSLHNYGQSEDPASPHYLDQAEKLESPAKLKEVAFDLKPQDPRVKSVETLTWSPPWSSLGR